MNCRNVIKHIVVVMVVVVVVVVVYSLHGLLLMPLSCAHESLVVRLTSDLNLKQREMWCISHIKHADLLLHNMDRIMQSCHIMCDSADMFLHIMYRIVQIFMHSVSKSSLLHVFCPYSSACFHILSLSFPIVFPIALSFISVILHFIDSIWPSNS